MNLIVQLVFLLGIYKATGQEREIIFDDSMYVIFTRLAYDPDTIGWVESQANCVAWGGNLTTIDSKQVDSLLYAMLPTVTYQRACWIGLNDLENEAGTDASAFVWVDGSTSTYRQFGTSDYQRPSNSDSSYDCVGFRYDVSGGLSDGWYDKGCDHFAYCYFCQKPDDSRGCDLIYEGSCYRAFEVSDGINWLDAQSSCAVWGGDLTSITTERENNLVYIAVNDTVSNCWIGLYERDGDGMYQWVDGTVLNYTNWTGSAPTDGDTNDCVQMETGIAGNWIATDCEGTSNSFICKKPASNNDLIVGRFGQLINDGKDFQELSGDTFYFNPSLTLVCGGEENSTAIQWVYRPYLSSLASSTLTPTYASTLIGLSWITVSNSLQGYYSCVISNYLSYTIGLYDMSITTVALSEIGYIYIVGVDRENIMLLCDPMDNSVNLSAIMWTVLDGNNFTNPLNIFNESEKLPVQYTQIICSSEGVILTTNSIIIKAPELTITYGSTIEDTFSSVYPTVNYIAVPIYTRNISISIDIDGKWNLPDNTNISYSELTIPIFISQNTGVYMFYIINWDGEEQCAMQLRIEAITADAVAEVIYRESSYGYFLTPIEISWYTAQMECINWGGNLATIESKQIDSLLYYLTTETVSCWIGLNDVATEAGTDASAFVWADGSNSTYRQFATITNGGTEPSGDSGGANRDCVDFRYGNSADSDGWDDRLCDGNIQCYFCQKPGDPRGCDLIYEGSCYRAFEVSDGINWLDAQSSCAVWGGDLTSITTERENNLLYTAISDTVSNCWIGLYERDGDGMYQWVDGTVLSYTNWTGTAPTPDSTHDCVQMSTNGTGSWIAADCEATSNSFICKKSSNYSDTTGDRFGELINVSKMFRPLMGDIFLYNSTTLACKGEAHPNAITWLYSVNANLSASEVLTPTYLSTETGVSWLSVNNTKQGYYRCQITGTNIYTVGIYNTELTTVASQGISYQYIVGVDRDNILLLCDPMNSSYKLESLSWRLMDGNAFSNPLNVTDQRDRLPHVQTAFTCFSDMITILSSYIRIYVPEITITYKPSITQRIYTVYPAMNTITVEIGTEYFDISVGNMLGRWKLPNGTYISSSTVSYPILLYEYFGIYQFYLDNWDGDEVCVIQISILLGGYSMINSITLSSSETVQNGSTIVTTEDTTMINCVISDPEYSVGWIYRSPLDVETDVTESSTFSTRTGVSALNISSQQPGYYSCVINAALIFSFYIADRDTLVVIQNFDSPTQQVNYTADDTSSMLYYSHASIPDSSLRWTTDTVTDGADTHYSIEYPNPVLLSRVFSDVGGGVHTLSCFYRMSPVSLVGSLMLAIKDTVTVSISYQGYDGTFSDVYNPLFPSPQLVTIPDGTQNVILTCNLTQCIWMIQVSDGTTIVESSSYMIPVFRSENVGNYSLKRETNLGQGYETAQVHINLQQSHLETSLLITVPIVVVILLIVIVIVLIVVVVIIGKFIAKKVSHDKTENVSGTKSHKQNRKPQSEMENLKELTSTTTEYVYTHANPGVPEYMSIYETSMVHLETDTQTPYETTSYYTNEALSPTEDYSGGLYEMDEYVYSELSPSEQNGKYHEREFVSKCVTLKEFSTTYQQRLASRLVHDPLFPAEFNALTEEPMRYVKSSYEAKKVQNLSKNPIKHILPYDENRVVLESPYFECNYINASWINNNQFIASIHPTENTLQDFLQMIYQTEASMVIMLSTRKEKAKILGRSSNRVYYWTKKDQILKCGPFETNLNSSIETTAFVKQEISLKQTLEGKSHSFIHCISQLWNEDGTIVELNSVVSLLIRVMKQIQDYPLNPIIIHCENGISKTGVFLTVFESIRELNLQKSINIFNTVQNLRKQRMGMVPTMACYKTCYSLMNEYCSIHL